MTGLSKVEDYKVVIPPKIYPNFRKYIPHHRYITLDYFEPHKRLIKDMQKLERNHQELTDKHEKLIADKKVAILPGIKLARLEKRWAGKALKLRKLLGASS